MGDDRNPRHAQGNNIAADGSAVYLELFRQFRRGHAVFLKQHGKYAEQTVKFHLLSPNRVYHTKHGNGMSCLKTFSKELLTHTTVCNIMQQSLHNAGCIQTFAEVRVQAVSKYVDIYSRHRLSVCHKHEPIDRGRGERTAGRGFHGSAD